MGDEKSPEGVCVIGPVRFVISILWFAIALSAIGTIKDCSRIMAGYAVEANQQQLSLKKWNQKLIQ